MLGHLSLGVVDIERSRLFYDAALAALGFQRTWTSEKGLGYGPMGEERLNLFERGKPVAVGAGFHLAFNAPNRAAVDAFHKAALAAGGQDNGAPGLRSNYGERYYAAFVIDPDGHHLEAVHQ